MNNMVVSRISGYLLKRNLNVPTSHTFVNAHTSHYTYVEFSAFIHNLMRLFVLNKMKMKKKQENKSEKSSENALFLLIIFLCWYC